MRKILLFLLIIPGLLLGQSEGTITAVDTLQFESIGCRRIKMIRLATSDYFLVMYEGVTFYPTIKTFSVDADGNIGGSFQGNCWFVDRDILSSTGNTSVDAVRLGETDNYAVMYAYEDTSKLVTIPISSSDGTIGSHIDSVHVYESAELMISGAKMGHISDDLYWCMYHAGTPDFSMHSAIVEINTDGTIDSVCHETEVWNSYIHRAPTSEDFALRMGGGTYFYSVAEAINYFAYAYTFQDSSNARYLKELGWDDYNYYVSASAYHSVELVNDTSRYVIATIRNHTDYKYWRIFVLEVDTTDGSIVSEITNTRLYASETFSHTSVCKQMGSDTIFVGVASDVGLDSVYMATFGFNSANGAGATISMIDSIKVHTSTVGENPYVIHARGDIYLVAVDEGNIGKIYSFEIPPAAEEAAVGWAGKVNTVTNIGKINTVAKTSIKKINTVE